MVQGFSALDRKVPWYVSELSFSSIFVSFQVPTYLLSERSLLFERHAVNIIPVKAIMIQMSRTGRYLQYQDGNGKGRENGSFGSNLDKTQYKNDVARGPG